jgi:2-polyprenyl-6-methoxyphenol hydroxylase-like FAD-dependent oxidoreductase
MTSTHKMEKALVIGGGIAGLLAARVLSSRYEEVLIVERDEFPERPVNRPGVPQAYHPHRLLPPGKMILEKLFPGYTEELLAHGAFLRENKTVHLIYPQGSIELPEDRDVGSSRALFEWVMRQRIQQLANVHFLSMQEVTGLLTTPDQTRVTGVHLRERSQSGQRQTVMADLVVDASGRSSKLIRWLNALGYGVPEAERIKVSLGYSTRHYKIPPHLVNQWSVIFIESDPARGIANGVLGVIENNIAEMVLARAGGESYPTTDGDEYVKEVAKLLSPKIAEVLPELEPLDEPRGYRVPESFRYHFEAMPRWPAGLLVMGDALCNFDPVYGQGITVAAIEAEILVACLDDQYLRPRPEFERIVLQQMQDAIESAWWLSAVADLRWSGVEYTGSQPLKGVTFTQKYLNLVLKQAFGEGNMALLEKYFMVTGLVISPRELINAEMVNSVLEADASSEAQQLRDEFFGKDGRSMEEILDQMLPSFANVAMLV